MKQKGTAMTNRRMNRTHPQYGTAWDLAVELVASILLSIVLFAVLVGAML
jgi:F0F1-type ATP synthase assembly protein I